MIFTLNTITFRIEPHIVLPISPDAHVMGIDLEDGTSGTRAALHYMTVPGDGRGGFKLRAVNSGAPSVAGHTPEDVVNRLVGHLRLPNGSCVFFFRDSNLVPIT